MTIPSDNFIDERIKDFREKNCESIEDCDCEKDLRSLATDCLREGEERTEKAFGGCKKCYGKGYATVRIGTSSYLHSEIHTEVKICVCERGKQLRGYLEEANREGERRALERAVEIVNKMIDPHEVEEEGALLRVVASLQSELETKK